MGLGHTQATRFFVRLQGRMQFLDVFGRAPKRSAALPGPPEAEATAAADASPCFAPGEEDKDWENGGPRVP